MRAERSAYRAAGRWRRGVAVADTGVPCGRRMGVIRHALTAVLVGTFILAGGNKVSDQVCACVCARRRRDSPAASAAGWAGVIVCLQPSCTPALAVGLSRAPIRSTPRHARRAVWSPSEHGTCGPVTRARARPARRYTRRPTSSCARASPSTARMFGTRTCSKVTARAALSHFAACPGALRPPAIARPHVLTLTCAIFMLAGVQVSRLRSRISICPCLVSLRAPLAQSGL